MKKIVLIYCVYQRNENKISPQYTKTILKSSFIKFFEEKIRNYLVINFDFFRAKD